MNELIDTKIRKYNELSTMNTDKNLYYTRKKDGINIII